jgi:hypothetical protein
VSAAGRGIAEADSTGKAANAQAATPISRNRFMQEFSLMAAWMRHRENVLTAPGFRARYEENSESAGVLSAMGAFRGRRP